MTDDQINVAIAEACGWNKYVHKHQWDSEAQEHRDWTNWIGPSGELEGEPPNYCHDLNAMHEAENHIPDQLYAKFVSYLRCPFLETTKGFSGDGAYSATAHQRAEAFLRTLNLWRDQ